MPISPDEEHYAIFTDRSLADTVLRLFKMKFDEESEILEYDTDQNTAELKAGLKPWLISIELRAGIIQGKPAVELQWPPLPEGIITQNDGMVQYACWAKSPDDAIRRIPGMIKDAHETAIEVEA